MRHTTFAVEAAIEAEHWWFVGRRRLFAREIARRRIGPAARILDLGTSTGTNLRMLREAGFPNVAGLDSSEEALRWCLDKLPGNVVKGDITRLPFGHEQADLVLATDVIEHLDDDRAAIREIARVLKPGGAVLVAVPAFALLWGLQDQVAHHKRRYRKHEVQQMLSDAGLIVERSYYFNYLLFLPILLARAAAAVAAAGGVERERDQFSAHEPDAARDLRLRCRHRAADPAALRRLGAGAGEQAPAIAAPEPKSSTAASALKPRRCCAPPSPA